MSGWGKALAIFMTLILCVAVGLLIAASVQGMTIVEMIRSWVETAPEVTPPVEETVETTSLLINSLKF